MTDIWRIKNGLDRAAEFNEWLWISRLVVATLVQDRRSSQADSQRSVVLDGHKSTQVQLTGHRFELDEFWLEEIEKHLGRSSSS